MSLDEGMRCACVCVVLGLVVGGGTVASGGPGEYRMRTHHNKYGG